MFQSITLHILHLFCRKTGSAVAELLLHEIGENLNGRLNLEIDTEKQLSWILQVLFLSSEENNI